MSQSAELHDHAHSQAFYHWLEKNLLFADDNSKGFLPEDRLYEYLESSNFKVLNNLVKAIYEVYQLSLNAKEIVCNTYSKVFCILIRIGQIQFLPSFLEQDDLNDKHLPFEPSQRPNSFPIDPSNEDFFDKFCAEQWKFCPPRMTLSYNRRTFDDNRILPFISKTLIARGATAEIYKVEIYVYYNDFSETIFPAFALKTYRGKDAETAWENEIKAFKKLQNRSPKVIGFYTAFKQGNEYNALLEYADRGSLEDFMKSTEPPATMKDVLGLWKEILELLRGLKDLHQGEHIIWHQDVKPENILVLSRCTHTESEYNCKFKLADLGTSHSKRHSFLGDDNTDQDTQGTRTYGAPECYRSNGSLGRGPIRVTPKVDIWSLGCVLSEFATWMSGGYDKLKGYRQARRTAIQDISDLHDSDCFHNGTCVLPVVLEWHQQVRSQTSDGDPVASKVLYMVDEMLQEAQERGDAQFFSTKAHSIYSTAFDEAAKKRPHLENEDDLIPPTRLTQRQRTDPPVLPPEVLLHPNAHQRSVSQEDHQSLVNPNSFILPEPVTHSPDEADTSVSSLIGPASGNDTSTSARIFRALTNDTSELQLSVIENMHQARSSNQKSLAVLQPPKDQKFDVHSDTYPRGPRDIDPLILTQPDSFSRIEQIYSAPTEATTPFFTESEMKARRHSEQPPHISKRISRRADDLFNRSSTMLEPETQGIPVTNLSPNFVLKSIDPQTFPIGNVHHQRILNDFQLMSPPSPSSVVRARSSRPSTSLPLDLSLFQISNPNSSGSERQRNRSILPEMTVDQAISWRDRKKETMSRLASFISRSEPVQLKGHWALHMLQERDAVFIIDDAESMRRHWPELTKVFGILAYMIKPHDKDGLDVCFTSSKTLSNEKHTSKLVAIIEKKMNEKDKGWRDISGTLESVLGGYARKLKTRTGVQNVRPLNVYILTDGCWTPSCDVVPAIDNIVNTLLELKLPEKQVGLQFISFGDDKDGLARLKLLDSYLGLLYDIVDTTPSDGNPYKMLCGAINRDFDKENEPGT